MPALRELQTRFHQAVVLGEAEDDDLLACILESGETGRHRIAVYRRSVIGNLVGALLATYPALARIVGLPFFREAARAYVRTHPSLSGDLNEYGGGFADFLADWPYGRELGYLPDVARLEWLVQEAYYAADERPDLSGLATCPPQEYGALCFGLDPAVRRMDSAWPLADIWRVNAEDYLGDMALDFSRGSRLLVLRRDGLVHVEALAPGEAVFLDSLGAGKALEASAGNALTADESFDLGAALARLVANGCITRAWRPIEGEQA
ncbi:MAG: DNA-binding domain-containing protein [Rhodocyclaceae bacterium]|nr:DNA-binding domain-containing protein [Rhodocyclaceae bacterium]